MKFFQDSEGTIASSEINDNLYERPADFHWHETKSEIILNF